VADETFPAQKHLNNRAQAKLAPPFSSARERQGKAKGGASRRRLLYYLEQV